MSEELGRYERSIVRAKHDQGERPDSMGRLFGIQSILHN
jgi:hypothetical protein